MHVSSPTATQYSAVPSDDAARATELLASWYEQIRFRDMLGAIGSEQASEFLAIEEELRPIAEAMVPELVDEGAFTTWWTTLRRVMRSSDFSECPIPFDVERAFQGLAWKLKPGSVTDSSTNFGQQIGQSDEQPADVHPGNEVAYRLYVENPKWGWNRVVLALVPTSRGGESKREDLWPVDSEPDLRGIDRKKQLAKAANSLARKVCKWAKAERRLSPKEARKSRAKERT